MSPRTEMPYKAERPGKAAPHVDAQDSGRTVNGGVVQSELASLSGETCPATPPEPSGSARLSNEAGDQPGVSRGHSTAGALAERPEHDGRKGPRASSISTTKPPAGVDAMSTDAFPAFARDHWPEIRSALREGRYRPQPVRRVELFVPDA